MTKLEELARAAHDAPLNKVGMTHKRDRFLATHSMAWASASREYFAAIQHIIDEHEGKG